MTFQVCGAGSVIDFMEMGGVPDDASMSIMNSNGAILNKSLNALSPGTLSSYPTKRSLLKVES